MRLRNWIGRLLAAASMVLLLWLWQGIYRAPCIVLIVPLIGFTILFLGLRDSAIKRRRMIASAFLEPDSPLFPWMTRKIIITLQAMVVAAVLTVALFLSATMWGSAQWWLLCGDALLIVALHAILNTWLEKGGVRTLISPVLSRRWVTAINVPILLILMFTLQLNSAPPERIYDQKLSQIVELAAKSTGSECRWVNTLVKLQRESDAMTWWLMVRGSAQIGNELIRWLAWIAFLLGGGVTWWGFSRLVVESVDFVHRALTGHDGLAGDD